MLVRVHDYSIPWIDWVDRAGYSNFDGPYFFLSWFGSVLERNPNCFQLIIVREHFV